jgi:hypothetical protein
VEYFHAAVSTRGLVNLGPYTAACPSRAGGSRLRKLPGFFLLVRLRAPFWPNDAAVDHLAAALSLGQVANAEPLVFGRDGENVRTRRGGRAAERQRLPGGSGACLAHSWSVSS